MLAMLADIKRQEAGNLISIICTFGGVGSCSSQIPVRKDSSNALSKADLTIL